MINQGGRVFKQRRIAAYDAPCVVLVKKHGGIILLVSKNSHSIVSIKYYVRKEYIVFASGI